MSDLNHDLGERYGLPVEFNGKIGGLTTIARALNRGDLIHATIAALHLQIPDPPILRKAALTKSEINDLACRLKVSGLLKAGGLGPHETSSLAGWKRRRHRWGICAQRDLKCARGADHPFATDDSSTVRTSRGDSVPIGDITGAARTPEYQSPHCAEKSLPRSIGLRRGMGAGGTLLHGIDEQQTAGKGWLPGYRKVLLSMPHGPSLRGLWRKQHGRLIWLRATKTNR